MQLHDSVSAHFKLDTKRASALRRLQIHTVRDLLYHFPARYDAAGTEGHTNALTPGEKVTLIGKLSKLEAKKLWKSRRTATEGWFEDSAGKVKVLWFNQPYIKSYVREGEVVKLIGVVGGKPERPYIANPEITHASLVELAEPLFTQEKQEEGAPRLFPVYPETVGVTSRWFYHAMKRIFKSGAHLKLPDPIPETTRERLHLPDLPTALIYAHAPEKAAHAEAARKRFAFEEIFALQVARAQEKARNDAEDSVHIEEAGARTQKFLDSLEMQPTGAQRRAISEIAADMEKPHPMARLLEGDVGSGKTLVAAAVSYAAVTARPPLKFASGEFGRSPNGDIARRESGTLQVAYMAPTEILAQQHFESFIRYFRHLPINIALVTGSVCKKFPSKVTQRLPAGRQGATDISRAQLLKWVASGEIAMLVGTHALIQKAVRFQNLALCIVDEQHRFGTSQRRALSRKQGSAPHFLSMTATPIPRTLALTLYGDLDLSVLDELPPGRAKIETSIVLPKAREKAYATMCEELAKGRQAYVICPRIEEPDPKKLNALMAKSAKAEAKRLQQDIFPEYSIGLMHGAMKADDKEEVMRAFYAGEYDILVATSVVEVGVNVPNATVIMIEGAERFGLSQLHQLRGRVMRSSNPPFCFLVPETSGEVAMKRLRALAKSSDGFALAEEDLLLRGAGDLYGRQQWGVTDLGMEALKNPRLIQAAREEAAQLVKEDSSLSRYPALQERAETAESALHAA